MPGPDECQQRAERGATLQGCSRDEISICPSLVSLQALGYVTVCADPDQTTKVFQPEL